jgi:hypothetical protein
MTFDLEDFVRSKKSTPQSTLLMPRAKERRGRHGAGKKSPRKKNLSSHADIKETSKGNLSGHNIANPPTAQSSSAVSANWKNLAKVSRGKGNV